MGIDFLPVAAVVLTAAFVLACCIKLRYYKVESIRYYLLIPMYPVIVLCLNIYSLHELCNGKRLRINIVITLVTLYVTLVNMPVFIGLLCHLFRIVECEKVPHNNREKIKFQTDEYSKHTAWQIRNVIDASPVGRMI